MRRLLSNFFAIFLTVLFASNVFAQNEVKPPSPTPVTPGKNWSIVYTSGNYAMLVKYDGTKHMVKESEQVQDQVFGDFKILLIEDDKIKIQHTATGSIGWITNKQKVKEAPEKDTEENIQFSISQSIIPESKSLDYQFDFPIKTKHVIIQDILRIVEKELDLNYVIKPYGSERVVSVDLDKPTLRELLLAMLPPNGLWFNIQDNVLTIYPIKNLITESPTDSPIAAIKGPHHPVFDTKLKGEVTAAGMEVTQILQLLTAESDMNFVLESMGEIPKVSFSFQNPTVGDIVKGITYATDLTYSVKNDVILFSKATDEDTETTKTSHHPLLDTQLKGPVEAVQLEFTHLLPLLEAETGLKFEYIGDKDNIPKVTFTLSNPTVSKLIYLISNAYDLEYFIEDEVVKFKQKGL